MTQHSEASEPVEPIEPVAYGECGGPRAAGESTGRGDPRAVAAADAAGPADRVRPTGPAPVGPVAPEYTERDPFATDGTGSVVRGSAERAGPARRAASMLVFSHPGRPGHGAPAVSEDEGAVCQAPDAAGHLAIEARAQAEQVTLRSPAELADALPYLLGYRPEDSIVLVAVHDRNGYGSFGGRARLGIPARREDWPEAAREMARCLVSGCERRGAKPEGMVAFLSCDPEPGGTGRQTMEVLRPLAQLLRTECGSLDVPVLEALCLSDGRFWSYCCPSERCCPEDGTPMGLPGVSVLSAAMTYAGLQVRGTLKELRARLMPWESAAAREQESVLDTVGTALVFRILDESRRADVAAETLELGRRVMARLAGARPVLGLLEADQRDDEIITHDEAAALILGLQDRNTRDRAAEWMADDEAGAALRLWRALARRCVGPYGEHAAVPLTLAGWVAWSMGDELEAREALAMALAADPDYLFAQLLHQACNEGLDPESIRRCLRGEREERTVAPPAPVDGSAEGTVVAGAVRGRSVSPADTARTVPPSEDAAAGPESTRAAACRPASERVRRPESRGPGRRGPRPARPPRARTTGQGPGPARPPGRRATGRG